MSDILDTLRAIFKGANPDKSDDEINTQVQSYSQDPEIRNALKDLLPPTDTQTEDESTPPKTNTNGDLTVNPDVASLKLPSANSVQSSFDVNTTPSPVTMNGATPAMPTGNMPQVNPALPAPTPTVPTMPPTMANTPSIPSSNSSQMPSNKSTTNPVPAVNPLDNVGAGNPDYEARKQFEADEARRKGIGTLATMGAGIGDAITNASTAFGGKGGSNGMENMEKSLGEQEKLRKEQFETNLKADPNSEVSQHYRTVLGMMMNKKPTDPQIANLSAEQIAQTMPEVEKFMAKELGLKQIQANKELSMSMAQGNERDRMWNQAVQTINQIRGDKPLVDSEVMRNGAISAYQAIDNIQKQGRAPNQYEYVDLLGQLWKARTGATLTNEELKHMDPKTIQSQLGPIATYFTGDPKAITTPAATNAIKDFVIQSGKTADQIHDNYMQTRGVGAAASRMKQLYPDDADRLSKMARGMSFSDATGISYKNPAQTNQSAVPTITSQQDYDMLPSGASYQDANGKVYRKK